MKKYRVKVYLSGSKTVEVDAYDKDHARTKALRSIRFRPDGGHKFICQVEEIKGLSNKNKNEKEYYLRFKNVRSIMADSAGIAM